MTLQHAMGPVVAFVTIALAIVPCEGAETGRGLPSVPNGWECLTPVSDSFVRELETAARTVPEEIWRIVNHAGWRVKLADSVVGAVPSLRDTAPRGWPTGWTWDNTDAVHLPVAKQLVIAEKRRNERGQIVSCNRVGGVLRHELGHAFDIAGDRQATIRSATQEFRAAYMTDISRMGRDQRKLLHYYLQQDGAGPQETFAEAFGVVLGGGSDALHQVSFTTSFPTVISSVQQTITGAKLQSVTNEPGTYVQSTVYVAPVPPRDVEKRGRFMRRPR